jgi:Zn-dependent protease
MKKFAFSRIEIRDILISVVVLSLVFSYPEILKDSLRFLIALVTIGVAFMGHELSHKFTARKFGYFSEYRMWVQGLLLAVLFTVLTDGNIIFAAPGAVVFSSGRFLHRPKKGSIGKIGLSGPIFNIILFALTFFLFILTANPILSYAAMINAWLAVFNLIPVPPLDGSKVFMWNKGIWLLFFAIAASGLIVLLI